MFSEIYQQVQDATYEAAAEGLEFTIITWRKHGDRIKLYRLNEKAGFWIVCGFKFGGDKRQLPPFDHPPLIGNLAQQAIRKCNNKSME